jgi:hypothetical protein
MAAKRELPVPEKYQMAIELYFCKHKLFMSIHANNKKSTSVQNTNAVYAPRHYQPPEIKQYIAKTKQKNFK